MARTHIKLNGQKYSLAYDMHGVPYEARPQPLQTGEDKEKFWLEWLQRSFHGGERLTRILDKDDLEANRYSTATGLDVSEWGQAKLQPSLTRSLAVQSATMPMCVTTDGARVIVGLTASPFVKIWYNGAWSDATAVAGSGAVTDIIPAGTTLYGVRGGGVITSTDSGANWSAVGAYTTAVGVAYLNGELIVLKSDGVYNHSQTASISSIGGTSVAAYRENLYWVADRRVFRYTGIASYVYDELPIGFVATALMSYRMVLLILGYFKVQGGYKGAVYYIINGSENHLYSLGDYSADYRIYAACGGDDELYIASPQRGGVDRYDLTHGGLACGPATGAAGKIPFKSLAYADGYLFMGRYDASGHSGTAQATGNDTTHTKLAAGASASNDAYNGLTIAHTGGTGSGQSATISDYDGTTKIAVHGAVATPADDTTTYVVGTDGVYVADVASPSAWATTGVLVTPDFDFGFPSRDKLAHEVTVTHDALVTGQSIKVEISYNRGGTYATLGTSATVGATSATYTVDSTAFLMCRLRFTVTGPGTSTPTWSGFVLSAGPISDVKWVWNLTIEVWRPQGGSKKLSALQADTLLQSIVDFEDVYGTSHRVFVSDARVRHQPDNEQSGVILMELREI